MRKIEKAKPWDEVLKEMQAQLAASKTNEERDQLSTKITNLQRAMAIRASLSSAQTPRGKVEFSL